MVYVIDRTALKALGMSAGNVEFLADGMFICDVSDRSAAVTADPNEGIYIAPNADPSGASGAWVRADIDEVNPKWFGAVGDGIADDEAAINAAVAVVDFLGGGTVKLRRGTYSIADTIILCSNLVFTADGAATIKLADGEVENVTSGGAMVYAFQKQDIQIRGVHFDGNKANNDTNGAYGDCIRFQDCQRVRVDDVHVRDAARCGIVFTRYTGAAIGTKDVSVTNCLVTGCGAASQTQGGEGIMATEGEWIRIAGNICRNNKLRGINLEILAGTTITDFVIADNICDGNARGIGCYGAMNGTVSGNTCSDNTEHGIDLQSGAIVAANVAIAGNHIRGSSHGIGLVNQQLVTATGNQMSFCGTGIYMAGVSIAVLTGNMIDASTDHGIDFTSGANAHLTIVGNYVGRSDQGNSGKSNISGNAANVVVNDNRMLSGSKADYALVAAGSAWMVTGNNMVGGGVTNEISGAPSGSSITNNLGA